MKQKLIAALALLIGVSALAQSNVTTTTGFNVNNRGVLLNLSPTKVTTLAYTPLASGVISISTNYTALSFGTVTNAGMALLINITTNSWATITYGTVSNSYGLRLSPGGSALVEFNTNSWGGVALTNACDMQYIILSR